MSPTGDHDHIEELIAAEALGGLDEPDRLALDRELAAHGPGCSECGRLFAEYGQTAADLALTLEPIPLSPGAEDRLMERALGEPASKRGLLQGSEPAGWRARVTPVRRWVATAAVAAAVLVAVGFLGYGLAPNRAEPTAVLTMAKGTRSVTVAYTPGEADALLVGTNLPRPPAGRVYELWYQPADGADMRPAGTFVPTDGSVVSKVRLGPSFVALAVSVEPQGGSLHPTSEPVYFRSL